ncbi:uncharacterized protein WCC33_012807 [Rhinophrynus dorsalis]
METTQVRKLRKKLRQIESLEHLPRELTPCEINKVSQKLELRFLLEDLLSRDVTMNPSEYQAESAPRSLPPDPSDVVSPAASGSTPSDVLRSADLFPLENSQFQVRCIKGHSDLVTCVLIHGRSIVSGSWDTSVRVWDVSSGCEIKTLCGHTGTVSCLSLIPNVDAAAFDATSLSHEDFVCSGSSDSTIKVWSLNTGRPVSSIYTFSAVSSLAHIPDTHLMISGSDGGKVDVWDLQTKQNLQSERAHGDQVTALQFHSGLLFSGSVEGSLNVWKVSSSGSLSLLHSSDAHMLSLRGLHSLCVIGAQVYIATQGGSVKVLEWKKDRLSRLSNHIQASGFVDVVAVTSNNLLVTSGYNIDQGYGFLNVRNGDTGRYLRTLSHPDAPRLLCFSSSRSPDGLCRWVTGGRELLLWEEIPNGKKSDSGECVQFHFCPGFLAPAADTESEDEEGEDLWESDMETSRSPDQGEARGWWWCTLV